MIDEIVRLLWAKIGLDPQSIGLPSIERAIQQRMAACRLPLHSEYLQRLRSSADELQALIEAVVVPETWFFRDPAAFYAVVEHSRAFLGVRPVRFLCAPCSTGEEPFSLAMALLDAGFARSQFSIDAIDVSARALAHAAAGLYGRNSFRGEHLSFRDRHFERRAEGYALSAAVRESVSFHQANLLEDARFARGCSYDAVFCRNLLIYFDAPTQERAIRALDAMLAPHGLLCVGPAETALLREFEFTQTPTPLAFAFRKGKVRQAAPQPSKPRIPAAPAPRVAPRQKPAHPRVPPPPRSIPLVDLNEAARLADEGRLDEVSVLCEASLRQSGPSAQAFFLLGLVSDAGGQVERAADYYRKALYLNPQHHDTLLHYSVLSARRGDESSAQALRARARRVSQAAA